MTDRQLGRYSTTVNERVCIVIRELNRDPIFYFNWSGCKSVVFYLLVSIWLQRFFLLISTE